jgi:hypothetical protein
MSAVNRMGQVALATLVCAMFLLPWERCRSDCHVRWVTPVVPHACHHGDCDEDEEPSEKEVDHAPVDLVAVTPRAPAPGLGDPVAAPRGHGDLPPALSRTIAADVPLRRLPPETPRTIVLLL